MTKQQTDMGQRLMMDEFNQGNEVIRDMAQWVSEIQRNPDSVSQYRPWSPDPYRPFAPENERSKNKPPKSIELSI